MSKVDEVYFFNAIKENIMDFLPDSFSGAKIEITNITKNNVMLTGLITRKENSNISPTIYLNDMYQDYSNGRPLDDCLSIIAATIVRAHENIPQFNLDQIAESNSIMRCLVNTKTNQKMLEHVPHREVEDLSVVYRGIVEPYTPGEELATYLITNEMARAKEMSEEDLYNVSGEYHKSNLGYNIKGIQEMLFGVPAEDEIMFIATNDLKLYGAAAVLNTDVMNEALDMLGTDKLIFIPSSIHEAILIDGRDADYQQIQSMITEVNSTQVAPEEVLSASVYSYTKEGGLKTEVHKDLNEKELSVKDKDQENLMEM